ncbi:hypothetical protein [Flagellimonas halotolerans]|uniref:Uncharacterized protein n=1 Tax=Flagellimonas halotolerans TaxID=3112164 RepID=A0ABU6IN00_9FLAO|nr:MULTISPECIES: hypothetical protein [unclassified Allomuricauda]MEC3964537.1 hypothetical protein [Muricauda sp. SYSU M86414]MEC4264406.1 hypothetical protein [Muricauda sp. SYSU M84420]
MLRAFSFPHNLPTLAPAKSKNFLPELNYVLRWLDKAIYMFHYLPADAFSELGQAVIAIHVGQQAKCLPMSRT